MGFFDWLFGKRKGQWIGLPKRPTIEAKTDRYNFAQNPATKDERREWHEFKEYLRKQDEQAIKRLKERGKSDKAVKSWKKKESNEARCNQLKIEWEKCCKKEEKLVRKLNKEWQSDEIKKLRKNFTEFSKRLKECEDNKRDGSEIKEKIDELNRRFWNSRIPNLQEGLRRVRTREEELHDALMRMYNAWQVSEGKKKFVEISGAKLERRARRYIGKEDKKSETAIFKENKNPRTKQNANPQKDTITNSRSEKPISYKNFEEMYNNSKKWQSRAREYVACKLKEIESSIKKGRLRNERKEDDFSDGSNS